MEVISALLVERSLAARSFLRRSMREQLLQPGIAAVHVIAAGASAGAVPAYRDNRPIWYPRLARLGKLVTTQNVAYVGKIVLRGRHD